MARTVVTTAGYYAGRFLKPGQSYDAPDGAGEDAPVDLEKLSKADILALAHERGPTLDDDATEAEIIAALQVEET